MKKYKGLFVPEAKQSKTIKDIQKELCRTSRINCCGIFCLDCLYYEKNIEQFDQWYNEKKDKP